MTVQYPNAIRGDVRHRLAGTIDQRLRTPDRYKLAVLADSPDIYLRLDEISGTTAADTSGNARTGTYQAGCILGVRPALTYASYYPNQFYSAEMGGLPTIVRASCGLTIGTRTYAGDFTAEAWIYITTTTVNFNNSLAGSGSNYIGFNPADQLCWFTGAVWVGGGTAAISVGTWHHFAMTRISNTIVYYLDGSASGTGGTSSTSAVFTLVGSGWTDNRAWCGLLDEFALYPSGLSSGRISAHYAAR